MKIVIFGATGFVGKSTLTEALKRDYQVTILVRDKSKVTIRHNNLTVIQGDVLDPQSVSDILKGQDAVIQVLGYNGKGNGKPTTFTTDATRIIIDGMQKKQHSAFNCNKRCRSRK